MDKDRLRATMKFFLILFYTIPGKNDDRKDEEEQKQSAVEVTL